MVRVGLILVCVVVLLIAGAFASLRIVGRRVIQHGRKCKPKVSDVAIVLGAYTDGFRPSRVLMDRLRAALDLYRMGFVDYFIVSGGRGNDETVAEASSMKRFLVLNGVDPDLILREMASVDTWENLRNSQQVMARFHLHTAVVVTSDYHLPRALAVAEQLGLQATGFAAWSGPADRRTVSREVIARIKYTLAGQAAWPSL